MERGREGGRATEEREREGHDTERKRKGRGMRGRDMIQRGKERGGE